MTNQENERVNRPAAQPLSGRRALVTGGASGIGLAVVHALAARGAHVIVADKDRAGAEAAAADVGGTSWVVDLLDPAAVADDRLAEALDGVDILVNNAGIQHISPIQDFDPAAFRRIMTLMLEVPFLLTRAALPTDVCAGIRPDHQRLLRARAARLAVQVRLRHRQARARGPVQGHRARGRRARGDQQLRQPRLRPDPAGGEAARGPGRVHGIPEAEVLAKIMLTESAIKRLIEPAEVASLVAWLAGDEASMVTGASYTMDGGWSAR